MVSDSAPEQVDRLLLRKDEMAKALGICPRLLHNWEKHEGLPVVRIRGSIRYSPDAVRTWIAERTTRAWRDG